MDRQTVTADRTVKKQRKQLVTAIKEADKMEIARMKRLNQAHTAGERDSLYMRFERERALDQSRIDNLVNDYRHIKQAMERGDLDGVIRQRELDPNRIDNKKPPKPHKNRFTGLESHEDKMFHLGRINKFDLYDRTFEDKMNRPVFDETQEKRKLKLLNERRDVLKSLVSIHAAELSACGQENNRGADTGRSGSSISSYSSYSSIGTNRLSNTPMSRFGSSSSSMMGARGNKLLSARSPTPSMATFASSSIEQRNSSRHGSTNSSGHRGPRVPPLNLHTNK